MGCLLLTVGSASQTWEERTKPLIEQIETVFHECRKTVAINDTFQHLRDVLPILQEVVDKMKTFSDTPSRAAMEAVETEFSDTLSEIVCITDDDLDDPANIFTLMMDSFTMRSALFCIYVDVLDAYKTLAQELVNYELNYVVPGLEVYYDWFLSTEEDPLGNDALYEYLFVNPYEFRDNTCTRYERVREFLESEYKKRFFANETPRSKEFFGRIPQSDRED